MKENVLKLTYLPDARPIILNMYITDSTYTLYTLLCNIFIFTFWNISKLDQDVDIFQYCKKTVHSCQNRIATTLNFKEHGHRWVYILFFKCTESNTVRIELIVHIKSISKLKVYGDQWPSTDTDCKHLHFKYWTLNTNHSITELNK